MNELEDLIEYMKDKKVNPLIVDAWDDKNKEVYILMKNLYAKRETREVVFGNFKIKIEYTPGTGYGMGECAPEFRTSVFVNFGA